MKLSSLTWLLWGLVFQSALVLGADDECKDATLPLWVHGSGDGIGDGSGDAESHAQAGALSNAIANLPATLENTKLTCGRPTIQTGAAGCVPSGDPPSATPSGQSDADPGSPKTRCFGDARVLFENKCIEYDLADPNTCSQASRPPTEDGGGGFKDPCISRWSGSFLINVTKKCVPVFHYGRGFGILPL